MGDVGSESPPKRPRGRPKGSPSPKSYYTPPAGAKPAELRRWLLQQSDALETLCRMAKGRQFKSYGPTGKLIWRHPTEQQQLWALDRVLRRCMPELSGLQLSGEKDGEPIRLEAQRGAGLPDRNAELARRLALALNMGGLEPPSEPYEPPPDGEPYIPSERKNGAHAALHAPAEVIEAEVVPVVGETVEVEGGLTLERLSHDGRPDGGGDWIIKRGEEELRKVRGLTQAGATAVAEALIEELGDA